MSKKTLVLLVVGVALIFVSVHIVRRNRPASGGPGSEPVKHESSGRSSPETKKGKPVRVITPSAVPEGVAPATSEHQARLLMEIGGLRLSEAVKAVIDTDGRQTDYAAREKAVKSLYSCPPSADDVQALTLFLDFRSADNKCMPALSFNAVKNDVLDFLLRRERTGRVVATNLTAMLRDNRHDDVWRDYCVQYMAPCYEKIRREQEKTDDPPELADLRTNLWAALGMKEKTIAGTALLGMDRLSRQYPEIDRKKVEQAALELALDERAGEPTRITALRICGQNGTSNVLATARFLAQAGDTTVLRMAAVATVGDVGDASDIELLHSLAGSSEKGLAAAANSAGKRLKARAEKAQTPPRL